MNVQEGIESLLHPFLLSHKTDDLRDVYPEERQCGAEPHAIHHKMNNGGGDIVFAQEPRLGT